MSSRRLAIVHWFPLEQYPPVMNLLDTFGAQPDWLVTASTCQNTNDLPSYENPSVSIRRFRFPSRSLSRLSRWTAYAAFQLGVLLRLLRTRPSIVLYIEPHSAFPAFLYCLIRKDLRVFVHYHEYRDQEEYSQPGMRLVRFNHWIERRFLYSRAEWISHTNADRNRMFRQDFPSRELDNLELLPNYPPGRWSSGRRATWQSCKNGPLRLVYVGAVSLHDTYIESVVEWILEEQSSADTTLDVFSTNFDAKTAAFLKSRSGDAIRFHARGVAYDQLPTLLPDYHVGLILYRARTRNYQFNASNKLFEYLALGLDVWFPPSMSGVKRYTRVETIPRIIETDFEQLSSIDLDLRRNRSNLPAAVERYSCEDAVQPMMTRMDTGTS